MYLTTVYILGYIAYFLGTSFMCIFYTCLHIKNNPFFIENITTVLLQKLLQANTIKWQQ